MNGPTTPGEVEVARDWLDEVLNATLVDDCDADCHDCSDLLTVTDPFDATNNETYHGTVADLGDAVTATAVAFMARRATWELLGREVWG